MVGHPSALSSIRIRMHQCVGPQWYRDPSASCHVSCKLRSRQVAVTARHAFEQHNAVTSTGHAEAHVPSARSEHNGAPRRQKAGQSANEKRPAAIHVSQWQPMRGPSASGAYQPRKGLPTRFSPYNEHGINKLRGCAQPLPGTVSAVLNEKTTAKSLSANTAKGAGLRG